MKTRLIALALMLVAGLGGYFLYESEKPEGKVGHTPFVFGLDLSGGTHLVYQADVSGTPEADIDGAMSSLRDTIEKRISVFGVAEPLVQVETANVGGREVHKLVVELAGVTETEKAIDIIGATPLLEFKLLGAPQAGASSTIDFVPTGLTGRLLERADLQFNPNTGEPSIGLTFNSEGAELFAKITGENKGNILAIFLDGAPLSTPVINEAITDGKAVITGQFTPADAKKLVADLNYGALPLPITLVGTQTVGATLGEKALAASERAGLWSFIAIAIFLVLWYRLPGLIAVLALAFYVILNLVIFKLVPVTLTSAGLAAFILSMGMAVDANILIFERMKEELSKGLHLHEAIREGFHRAWLSIRDSNLSSIITGFILYYFATSSLIKGFAFVFVIGVLTSMFTAITVSRTLLLATGIEKTNSFTKFLFGNGFRKN